MAKTKAAGTSRLGRDSLPKYLGVKLFEGQVAKIGDIIIRQKGSKFIAGKNVKEGRDRTLYAVKEGKVHFVTSGKMRFDRSKKTSKTVEVLPAA